MQQYSYMNIDDKKSLQILYHSFETTGNMHNVHIYIYIKKKRSQSSIYKESLFHCISKLCMNLNW